VCSIIIIIIIIIILIDDHGTTIPDCKIQVHILATTEHFQKPTIRILKYKHKLIISGMVLRTAACIIAATIQTVK